MSFVVVVTNEGPSAATDVQFIDAFPLDAAYFPVGPCDFLNGETVCRYIDAATGDCCSPGETFGVQIITVLEGDTPAGVYTNTARATTSTNETTLADNVDTRPIEVIEPVADLIIEKEAVTSPLVAGETFTYQIAVSAGVIDIANRCSGSAPTPRTSSSPTPCPLVSSRPQRRRHRGRARSSARTCRCNLGTVESSISLERQVPPTLVTITGTVAPGITGDEVDNTAVATTSTDRCSAAAPTGPRR